MINLKMDTRYYKKGKSKNKKEAKTVERPNYDYRNDPDYLRPPGACHCDSCVQDRYWAGDSR